MEEVHRTLGEAPFLRLDGIKAVSLLNDVPFKLSYSHQDVPHVLLNRSVLGFDSVAKLVEVLNHSSHVGSL